MPLIDEDKEKDEWTHQEVLDSGSIVTTCQRYVSGVTIKNALAFGYDFAKYFSRIADGRAQLTLLRDDGENQTHHQKLLTPWILANRSVFPTTYH